MDRPVALVVDRDPAVRAMVGAAFERQGAIALGAATADEAGATLRSRSVMLLALDVAGAQGAIAGLIDAARALRPQPLVIELGSTESARDAAGPRGDVFDAVPKPIDAQRLARVASRALRQLDLLDELRRLRGDLQRREGYDGIVGRTEPMQRLRERLAVLARTDEPVWFVGEEGVGKELAARTVHATSERRTAPFILVNCGAVGARERAEAWFADEGPSAVARSAGGALYLENAPELPLSVQERLVRSLGAHEGPTLAGVRLLAASRQHPAAAAADGRLIEPLRHRLAARTVELPALRERVEDIALLANHFVAMICEINHLPPIRISAEALRVLEAYFWPGNVQELRNAVEHAVILAADGIIRPTDLPDRVRDSGLERAARSGSSTLAQRPFREAKREVVETFERAYLIDLLESHAGNVTAAARHAGMLRSALQRLLRKYEIKSVEFRKSRRLRRGPRDALSSDEPR